MARNLLHKTKLPQFKAWLESRNIVWREPRGDFQVMQVKLARGTWGTVYDRIHPHGKEHFTVTKDLEGLTQQFIADKAALASTRSLGFSGEQPESTGGG